MNPTQASAHALHAAWRAGQISVETIGEAVLARIAARDADVRAFVWHDRDQVRAQYGAIPPDAAATRAVALGPLTGVPVAIKDVIDTADMPTAYGAPIYADHRPARDAALVQRLRAAGALIVGKTATAEFAYIHAPATRNPRDLRHTPGGSSSGSAAAVADGMAALAISTQTGGSTIRPAAFCGVVGYKPTFGCIETDGLKALAPSMDTIGLHARDVADLNLAMTVLAPGTDWNAAMADVTLGSCRIAFYPGPHADEAQPDAWDALHEARARLAARGATIVDAPWPDAPSGLRSFGLLSEANRTIMAYEGARCLRHEYETQRGGLSDETVELIERGRATPHADYRAALDAAVQARAYLDAAAEKVDLWMTFPADGPAPPIERGTGSSLFCRAWTTVGAPALSLPCARGTGLPLGVQLVARPGDDVRLLRWGARAQAALISA